MSATATPHTTIDTDRPGVPMTRLIAVETRKSFDTRAGRWFSFSILGLCALVMLVVAFLVPAGNGAQDFEFFVSAMGGTLGYFLPIIAIMLVTSEWGQRTGLVTFTLEPRRSRVVVAKLVASLIITIGVMILALALGALGTILAGSVRGADVSWSLDGKMMFTFFVTNVIVVLIGFAFAMLLMNTAAAIVAYFVYSLVLPIVVGIVGSLVDWFGDLAPWIEFNTAQTPLFTGDFSPTGEEWGQIATSGFLWLVLPLAFGIWRLLRSEVK
ncbi:ABC transporter permease [Aeromicrobium sp. CF4.19]|uniref:ABC transporter permease n=1 Tax=Aeromicrobium sp. CF4.19 TaxID=3373082 RepID=UPI003EE73BD1